MIPPTTVLHELFDQALALPPEKRPAFLREACAGNLPLQTAVEELLTAHERAGAFLSSPEIAPAALPTEQFAIGVSVGPYTLRKIIGEGGYGIVYLADQSAPLRRRVALKVIKAGMDTRHIIARFELERQALALMEHPNIAKVLDAGATTTGRPYFVMEYVDGVAITDFARERRLSLPDRLRLFQNVCAAVRHAHQKGIIHRDIKPANVLVTLQDGKPLPKVIDFGIAKALSSDEPTLRTTLTQSPQLLGTPQYMSPEQAAAGKDIDSRTDIYSLGVLLYELLTGTPPLDPEDLRAAGYANLDRILREGDPTAPSAKLFTLSRTLFAGSPVHAREIKQLARHLRGDLDWITLKAMEKDRARRYESVADFSEDITRFLQDQPIAAGPPGWRYRTGKFLRRHRRRLLMVLIAVFGILLGIALSSLRSTSNTSEIASTAPVPGSASAPTLFPGIIARLYSGSQFEQLVTSRVDATIDFDWPRGKSPAPGVSTPHYSVRWEGTLAVPAGGVEEIEVTADDGAQLFIDGNEILQTQRPATRTANVPLIAGKHALRLDYWNRIAQGHAILRWKRTGGTMEVVPPDAFFHASAASEPFP